MILSVIILNWNTEKLLKNCLQTVFKQTKGLDFEVIVVDNASADGSKTMVKKEFPQAKVIVNPQNWGYAKGNNQGLKAAKGEWLLLLNTDTKLKARALTNLVAFARTKPKLGVVGPRLLNMDGSFQASAAPFFNLSNTFLWLFSGDRFLYSSPPHPCQVDWVMGSAFLVAQKAIKKAGLLDEKFFMYLEDQEWCFRIKKAGFEIWFYPEAEIYHLNRGSTGGSQKQAIIWIYQSLVYFYQKHFAPWKGFVLKLMLKAKAAGAWLAGGLTGDLDLKETYAKAFKMA